MNHSFTHKEIERLDALYKRYGFTPQQTQHNVRAYLLRQGYFIGADLVPLNERADTHAAQQEFANSDYVAKTRNYQSVEDAENALFDAFFATRDTAERLRREYGGFTDRLSTALGMKYSYIQCRFSIDNKEAPGSLIDNILGAIARPGPQLVLVEAAAGFGKTCTAYEIAHTLAIQTSPRVPIFAELSRNRQARIFKYVLLDEIDRNHRTLGYELVRHEIQSGRIPLIIDGFDELLRKSDAKQPDKSSDFDDVETMLDTIGELLSGDAKIILTTRRTALFSDDRFYKWTQDRDAIGMTRINIREPQISDWIGEERQRRLTSLGFPLVELANPVLLSFIRSLTDEQLESHCLTPTTLIEHYFNSMLNREQERQNLRIDVSQQKQIFTDLARHLADSDLIADTRSSISETILSRHADALESARRTYPPSERPTIEELAETLAGHALLDRAGRDSNMVGFINDFVFGILLGDSLVADSIEEWPGTEAMVSRAATAYKVQAAPRKLTLWSRLKFALHFLGARDQLLVDIDLRGQPSREFDGVLLERLNLENCQIGGHALNECTFVGCVFRNVSFSTSLMRSVGFLDCQFLQCSVIDTPLSDSGIWTRGCDDRGTGILYRLEPHPTEGATAQPDPPLERRVLEQFWPRGRASAKTQREYRTLFLGIEQKHHKAVVSVIDSLVARGLMIVHSNAAELVSSRMSEIRHLLGRDS